MTDRELKKLSRAELLEIMYELRKQLDKALQENDQMVSRIYRDKYGELPEAAETDSDSAEEQSDGREEHSGSDD